MTLSYIGLGSNLDSPIEQLIAAIKQLTTIENSSLVAISALYGSRPMGPQDQPDYVNAVAAIETNLSPLALLDALQQIENNAGRVRKDERWGARVLDLDIILFGNQIIENDRLTVPHYGMKEREFVLIPLAEIKPDLILPCGEKVEILADNIANNGLEKLKTLTLSDFTG